MPKLPTIAIIGRPNTGKSTLFNRLVGSRKAIVSPIPGTTRDHVSHRVLFGGIEAILIDTGGIGSTRDKDFEKDVASQSLLALEHADLIVFTVNGKEELTTDDRKVLDLLRKKRRRHVPVIVAVTKADNPAKNDELLSDFQEMNLGEAIFPVSAPHNLGIVELEEEIEKQLKKNFSGNQETRNKKQEEAAEPGTRNQEPGTAPRLAIVGRPNVGKSSIVNALMSPEELKKSPALVSPIAGTTRDAVDMEVRYQEKIYVLVDTAGLKKHARTIDEIEQYSMMRTITAIESADIVILVLDALEPIVQQDKRIASIAVESGKGLILLLNKIDGLRGDERKKKVKEVSILLRFCPFAKIIPVSAKTKEGLLKLFDQVEAVQQSRTRRISTRDLRRWFEQVSYGKPLGEIAKTKHLTQAADIPPTFVLFVKNPKKVSVSQLRYLENRLRETFGFDGTPIRWVTKSNDRNNQ